MIMNSSIKAFLIAAIAVWMLGTTSLIAQQRTITVIGEGDVQAIPETVTLSVTVTSQDASALGVFVKNDDAVSRLRKSLEGAGLTSNEIMQGNYMVNPTYDYSQPNASPRLIGFHLITPINITIKDIKQLSRVMDLATQSGVSNINIGGYGLRKKDELRDRATKEALEDARERAQNLAKQIGATLGDVVSISDVEAGKGGGGEEYEREGGLMKNTLDQRVELRVTYNLK